MKNSNSNKSSRALTHDLVFYRTYSRLKQDGTKESWEEVAERNLKAFKELGKLTNEESSLLKEMLLSYKCLPSGRALWAFGTPWSQKQDNYYGVYNCNSNTMNSWESFAHLFDLGMQGTGTGADIQTEHIKQLPKVINTIELTLTEMSNNYGSNNAPNQTQLRFFDKIVNKQIAFTAEEVKTKLKYLHSYDFEIVVADSRLGWVDAYYLLLRLSSTKTLCHELRVTIDLSYIRPAGEPLNGFGGVANPIKLPWMFERVVGLLNKVGQDKRQVSTEEACLLVDIPAICYVAGNIRRCLAEDTLVSTPLGFAPISTLQEGDTVLTDLGYKTVTDIFDQGLAPVYEVVLLNEKTKEVQHIEMTQDHKVYIAQEQCKPLSELKEGDKVLGLIPLPENAPVCSTDEVQLTELKIHSIKINRMVHTYDIEVEEVHRFFANNVLVSNSAGMRQTDSNAPLLKENLWVCDENGNWSIDPERDPLRAANHTRVYHHKPTLEELREAVQKQLESGEGAIQYAPEALARANADIINTAEKKARFLSIYTQEGREAAKVYLANLFYDHFKEEITPKELGHRITRVGLNPCGKQSCHITP